MSLKVKKKKSLCLQESYRHNLRLHKILEVISGSQSCSRHMRPWLNLSPTSDRLIFACRPPESNLPLYAAPTSVLDNSNCYHKRLVFNTYKTVGIISSM